MCGRNLLERCLKRHCGLQGGDTRSPSTSSNADNRLLPGWHEAGSTARAHRGRGTVVAAHKPKFLTCCVFLALQIWVAKKKAAMDSVRDLYAQLGLYFILIDRDRPTPGTLFASLLLSRAAAPLQ